MIREFFYLQKSDRKVILTLLVVMVVALSVIFLTGEENSETNALTPTDTTVIKSGYDKLRKPRTSDIRTRVVYRDRPYYSSDSRASSRRTSESRDSSVFRYPVKIRETEYIVLNSADTTVLQTVPGIGPYYARQIVRYGERLGGYVSVSQLDEIEDFPLESKKYFVIKDSTPRKLNVNRLTLNELKRHPYINFYQARAITDYRRLHGPIRSLDELRLSKDFSSEAISRLSPYVEY